MSENPMDKYDEFFSLAYQPGAMDEKTKHLVALAASLGAGCQP
jgi:alkylhydroperoxidase/carboxymuconolactone decarboxylase family protein YurZ